MRVQAFVSEPPIERYNECIVGRLAGPAEVQRHSIDVCPMLEGVGDELRPIVHPDLCRRTATLEQQPVHDIDDLLALQSAWIRSVYQDACDSLVQNLECRHWHIHRACQPSAMPRGPRSTVTVSHWIGSAERQGTA